MDTIWHRRLWVLVTDFLTIHEVALSVSLTCKGLLRVVDHEEVWKPKLLQFLWYRSNEILLANPKTSMKLCYLKSKRTVDFIEGSLASFAYDFNRSTVVIHCSGLPFRSLTSVCVLRNGDIFGKAAYFTIFDVHSYSLLTISQPSSSHESGFAVAGQHCVYYVTPRLIQRYELLTDQWTDVQMILPHFPLNAFRKDDTLFVAHHYGFTEVNVHTWQAVFRPFVDERVHRCPYVCSFLCSGTPVLVTKSLIAVGTQHTVNGDRTLIEIIPKDAIAVAEDDRFVFFGRRSDLFRYSKEKKKIEQFYCGGGGIDRSLEYRYRRQEDKKAESPRMSLSSTS